VHASWIFAVVQQHIGAVFLVLTPSCELSDAMMQNQYRSKELDDVLENIETL